MRWKGSDRYSFRNRNRDRNRKRADAKAGSGQVVGGKGVGREHTLRVWVCVGVCGYVERGVGGGGRGLDG